MAKIKARVVSESASGVENSPVLFDGRRLTPSTDEDSDRVTAVPRKGTGKARVGPSPRRTLRRLSASEEVKRIAEEDSGDGDGDDQPRRPTSSSAPLPPPREAFDADDLNRFISSTTVATSTTISTSFVKHAGPRKAGREGMRMIRPDDVQGLVADRVGKMRYDKAKMRWIREEEGSGLGKVDEAGESRLGGSEGSEDVFAGMESWRDDVPPAVEDFTSDSDHDGARQADNTQVMDVGSESSSESELDDPVVSPLRRPVPVHVASAPAIMTPAPHSGPSRPIRSALRNAATPAGLLKKRTGWHDSVTPAGASGSKRSVSFSDGKKSGKIEGRSLGEGSWAPSARTKRIAGLLEDMEELSKHSYVYRFLS